MAQTQSADYWSGVRGSLTDLLIDFGRSRLIDVETANDDRNIPDRIDAGQGIMGGGSPLVTVLIVAAVVVVAVIVAKKVA